MQSNAQTIYLQSCNVTIETFDCFYCKQNSLSANGIQSDPNLRRNIFFTRKKNKMQRLELRAVIKTYF